MGITINEKTLDNICELLARDYHLHDLFLDQDCAGCADEGFLCKSCFKHAIMRETKNE
jgi:hypothetical protein